MNINLSDARWRGVVIRLLAITLLLAGGLALGMGFVELGRTLLVIGIVGALTGLLLNMLVSAYQKRAGRTKTDETARSARKVKR